MSAAVTVPGEQKECSAKSVSEAALRLERMISPMGLVMFPNQTRSSFFKQSEDTATIEGSVSTVDMIRSSVSPGLASTRAV